MKCTLRGGVEVPASADWDALESRKKLQLRTLGALVDKFEKFDIDYYLAYGCLIGLMRHGGRMIPWDDDVDLVMPRKDYDAAIATLMNDSLFKVLEFTVHSDFRVKSAKVALVGAPAVSRDKIESARFVDIFALDEAPRSKFSKYIMWKIRVLIENVVLARKGISCGFKKIIGLTVGALLPKDVARLHRIMVRLTSMPLFSRTWSAETIVGELYGAYGEKCLMPWGVYYSPKGNRKENFEGIKVKVPFDTEAYLRYCYGDWRRLPPVEQRIPKHENDDPWFYSELVKK